MNAPAVAWKREQTLRTRSRETSRADDIWRESVTPGDGKRRLRKLLDVPDYLHWLWFKQIICLFPLANKQFLFVLSLIYKIIQVYNIHLRNCTLNKTKEPHACAESLLDNILLRLTLSYLLFLVDAESIGSESSWCTSRQQ